MTPYGEATVVAPPTGHEHVHGECPQCVQLRAERRRNGPHGPVQSVCAGCKARKMRERVRRHKQANRVRVKQGRIPRHWRTLLEVAQMLDMTPAQVITTQARAVRKLRTFLSSGSAAMYEMLIENWLSAVGVLREEGLVDEAEELRAVVEAFREFIWRASAEEERPVGYLALEFVPVASPAGMGGGNGGSVGRGEGDPRGLKRSEPCSKRS